MKTVPLDKDAVAKARRALANDKTGKLDLGAVLQELSAASDGRNLRKDEDGAWVHDVTA